uniref:uncharacterized protein LOC122608381 n=1 Tax=Erigeron canadensis TaxID=72917 RepID=UPI001CB8BC06|nr:uncharacterized protein LOC122608381 [Erigeron canadensis]
MGRTRKPAWRNSNGEGYKRNKIQKITTRASTSKGSPQSLKKTSLFVSDDAEKRFNKFTSKRKLFMERGFTWSESSAPEFPDTITQAIRFHKWENFCQHPSSACIAVVQEFYANYDADRPDSVFVRGKLVDVTASSINSLFELTDHQGTLYELSSKLLLSTMSDILEKLTEPGTVHTRASDGTITFPRKSLKAGLNIWFNFVQHNLLPSADDTIVEKDRAILLYCILVGKRINVGKVIAEQIGVCASHNDGSLWFPVLITRLCNRHNVPLSNLEPIHQPYSPLAVNLSKQTLKSNPIEIESDQETTQSYHAPSTPAKPSSLPHSDSEVVLLMDDDGDEELLDHKLEQQELVENVSSMLDCLGQASPIKASSPGICVHGYKVQKSNVPILEDIFKKHGDIAAKSIYTITSMRSSFLEGICEVVRLVNTNHVVENMEEIEHYVSQAEQAKIDVSWLRAHLEALQKTKDAMENISLLEEMKANTVLVKQAALKVERQRCAELLAAQERFVEADRCVSVLHFVEKYLGDNLVKSEAEKALLVTQPIL